MLQVLSRARPTWTARDAAAAQQKLAKIGVTTFRALEEALEGPINDRLKLAGQRTFTVETIHALKQQLQAELAREASEPPPAATAPAEKKEGAAQESPAAKAEEPSTNGTKADAAGAPQDGALVSDAKPAEPALPTVAADGFGPRFEVHTGDLESLGFWILSHNSFVYEIRSAEECGRIGLLSGEGGAAEAGPAVAPQEKPLLRFVQRYARGEVVHGALKRVAEEGSIWEWEAALSNEGGMMFRRRGPQMLTRYRPPEKSDWEVERSADRPQGYAFYDSDSHNLGYRFAHLGNGEGGGGFPIIGLTAGWLPVSLVDVPRPDLFNQRRGEVKVRFLGSFSDPFEASPPPSLANKIRAVPPRPFGGNPQGQILLTGDGGITVQPPSTPATFGGPLGKGWRKPGKPGFRPILAGKGPLARSAPPSLNPSQTVAAAFGVTTSQLRDKALFRGKLRSMPHRRCVNGLEMEVPAVHFRAGTSGTPGRPVVSILCLRWYDYWSDPNPASDYNILNDGYFSDLFHGPRSMGRVLPGEYEVYTIFIQRTRDIMKLHPHHLRAMLRGQNTAAWYFLWPSTEGTGYVREPEFFAFCQAMERVPLRSCWPHESTLYRQLCGKLWIPQMSLNKRYRVPPTVRVHYAEFLRDSRKTARRALESIMLIRRTVWGKSDVSAESFRGVVKLGFSWCGSDVLPFQGMHSLITNLRKLFENELCENATCLVQEMVPGVVGEHRILCLYDKFSNTFHKEALWIENVKESSAQVKHNVSCLDVAEFKMASSITMRIDVATKQCFEGDRFAMRLAEQDALHLVDCWLRWYRTECPEPPQCTRIDFMVTHPGPGRADVWTCEVGECGASLCSVEVHGRNIASLNSAVLRDSTGRFPQRMPSEIPRNSGQKS